MAESDESAEPTRGVLDTSVVIDHDLVDPALLPDESAIAAVTLAELAAGPHATDDHAERARRQDRQWAAATWQPLPLDDGAARLYGRVFAVPGLPGAPAARAWRTCSSRRRRPLTACHSTRGIRATSSALKESWT